MKCPACKGPAKDMQEVHKTVDTGGGNLRFRRCRCGATWTTFERLQPGSLVTKLSVTGDPRVTAKSVTGDPSVSLWGEGGLSGSGLSPDPISRSGSYSDQDPDLPARFKYPDAFEAVWAGTGGKGGKKAAFTAWKKAGSPSWGDLAAVWGAYMLSERVSRGFVKDLSGWFNGGYHQQEWVPHEPSRMRAVVGGGWRSSTGDDM